MANKDRNKRSARKARAAERERKAAAQLASAPVEKPKASLFSKVSDSSDAKSQDKSDKAKAKDKQIQKKKPGRIRSYFHDVRVEMKRVVWPSRPELRSYTTAVIIMLIISGVVLWAVDTGIVSLVLGYTGLRG